jgi:orotidine-5'-phosphate decarboxylase
MSLDRLIQGIVEKNNPTVVGLDPNLDFVPDYILADSISRFGRTLEAAADAVTVFNKGLIDAIYDIVPAVKPQCAYYELLGWQGMRALAETILYAKSKGMFVITDGKRNDIGATMEAYSSAHLGKVSVSGEELEPFGADALTVNAYLGSDGVMPLIKLCIQNDKGIFVLCKTSNTSSGDLQDRLIDNKPVYEIIGQMCEKWGEGFACKYGYSGVGAVVGATYPEQLKQLRKLMPKTFFLVPGYGAQGGSARDVAVAFDNRGLGAVVNSSRAIMCAYKKAGIDEHEFALAARVEAIRMRDEIIEYLPRNLITLEDL